MKFMWAKNMPEYQKEKLKKHDFITALKLAGATISPKSLIDMVLRSDIYWDFNGETKRGQGEHLVAVNSSFGWLISGPIKCSKLENDKTVTLIGTLMLKIGCYEANNEKSLNENKSKFWNLDVVGIKDNEISIYEKFKDENLNLKLIVILSSYQ